MTNKILGESTIAFFHSPVGVMRIAGGKRGIQVVAFVDEAVKARPPIPEALCDCVAQLDDYFAGTRKAFDLRLDLRGTAFEKDVWQALLTIPYGKTVSYMDIAMRTGGEKVVRAVGRANGRNPIAIIVPCHRVIGSDGALVGYGGGLWRKRRLLDFERRDVQPSLFNMQDM
jgi:methylated-DNA-[protein]-cysteine S-methyltransferase